MNTSVRSSARRTLWCSLGFVSVAVIAGCTVVGSATNPVTEVVPPSSNAPEESTAAVATSPVAPDQPSTCGSDDDCAPNHQGGLCLPKPANRELSDAENFLTRAMALHALVARLGDTSGTSPLKTALQQVRSDMIMYSTVAQGRALPDGGAIAEGAPPTSNQTRQDAAWFQSGATQADMLIRQLAHAFSHAPIATDAQNVSTDITGDSAGLHLDKAIADVQTLIHDIEAAVGQSQQLVSYRYDDGGVPDLKSAAGAMVRYVGQDLGELDDARVRVKMLLAPAATPQLERDLTVFARSHYLLGKDGVQGMCLRAGRQEGDAGGGAVKAR